MIRTLLRTTLVAVLLTTLLGVVHSASPASADIFTVSDPSDGAVIAPNTLRWAIQEANNDPNPPTIDIQPGLAIDLTCAGGGELAYNNVAGHPLTIEANGSTVTQTCAAAAVLSSTSHDMAVFDATISGGSAAGIRAGGDLLIEDSTIEGNTGGGLTAYTGTATVVRSNLQGNSGGAGGGVGAIHVVIEDSTLAGNDANNGGGAWSDQSLRVTNSTITDNTAGNSGGGIYAALNQIVLTYATIVENTAPAGANVDLDFSAQITSFASLIGAPLGGGDDCEISPGATVSTLGYNVTSDSSCGFDSGPGDLPDTDPQVGSLADNGGPTFTRPPAAGSPALDRADCAVVAITADQRGVPRPQGPACDSGAVEVEVGGDTTSTTTTGDNGPGSSRPATAVARTPQFTG